MQQTVNRAQQGVAVQVQALERRFGDFLALDRVDLALAPGRVLALLGPSGCGKSTLLKLLAGLDQPSAGTICFDGREVANATHVEPPQRRRLGMVFQDYALWPHMSVAGNVGFALRMQGIGRSEVQRRVAHALQRVGLAGMGERAPAALSGGQQQRVALARAIVAQPALLLFDEPLSNLDRDLRESLCDEIGELLREIGTTAVYVTHDHEEACIIADEVAVMFQGRITQRASPQQLWGEPASIEVARFLKLGALLPAWRDAQGIGIPTTMGTDHATRIPWAACAHSPQAPQPKPNQQRRSGHLLVPESAIALHPRHRMGDLPSADAPLTAQVVAQQYASGRWRTCLQLPSGAQLHSWSRERLPLREGVVGVRLDATQLRWFDAQPTRLATS